VEVRLVRGSDLDKTREVNQGEVWNPRAVYSEVDGLVGNGFVGGYGKVQVGEGSLDIGEIPNLPETESRELSILFLDTGCVDESEFDRPSRDPVVPPV